MSSNKQKKPTNSQQRDFLQCDADFMLAGRYCARSCNRPPCRAAPAFPTLAQLEGRNYTTPPCTDVPPSDDFTCDEQRQFGKCDANFIKNGGFCDRRCVCAAFRVFVVCAVLRARLRPSPATNKHNTANHTHTT